MTNVGLENYHVQGGRANGVQFPERLLDIEVSASAAGERSANTQIDCLTLGMQSVEDISGTMRTWSRRKGAHERCIANRRHFCKALVYFTW